MSTLRVLKPRASGFNPRSIAGLRLWLDANSAGSLTLNSGNVSQWGDLSGGANNASQSTANNQPAYGANSLNGRASLSFDGTSDNMLGSLSISVTGQTVVCVARITAATNSGAAFGRLYTQGIASYTSNGNQDFEIAGHYIPLLRDSTNSAIGSYAGSAMRAIVSIAKDTWFIACSRHTGSQIQNSINNGSAQTYSHTLNRSFSQYRIGNDLSSFQTGWWPGGVAEIIVYDRPISDSERNTLLRSLGKKWEITVS